MKNMFKAIMYTQSHPATFATMMMALVSAQDIRSSNAGQSL